VRSLSATNFAPSTWLVESPWEDMVSTNQFQVSASGVLHESSGASAGQAMWTILQYPLGAWWVTAQWAERLNRDIAFIVQAEGVWYIAPVQNDVGVFNAGGTVSFTTSTLSSTDPVWHQWTNAQPPTAAISYWTAGIWPPPDTHVSPTATTISAPISIVGLTTHSYDSFSLYAVRSLSATGAGLQRLCPPVADAVTTAPPGTVLAPDGC
jgi:hypothetical protein